MLWVGWMGKWRRKTETHLSCTSCGHTQAECQEELKSVIEAQMGLSSTQQEEEEEEEEKEKGARSCLAGVEVEEEKEGKGPWMVSASSLVGGGWFSSSSSSSSSPSTPQQQRQHRLALLQARVRELENENRVFREKEEGGTEREER